MQNHGWEEEWINDAKTKVNIIFKYRIYFINYLNKLFILQVLKIYREKYAPQESENIITNYNSEDEDLILHISKRSNFITDELEIFLKSEQALALTDPLNWWKVNYCFIIIFF